ncbi:MAG: radical SAM protein, partial [Pseudomonadota bacterium]
TVRTEAFMKREILRKIRGLLPSAASGRGFAPLPPEAVESYNRWRPAGPRRLLCYAPFTNLFFNRHGQVLACCHNHSGIMGAWPAQSIREIWTGRQANLLRSHIRHHDLSHGCTVCKLDLERGLFPEVKAEHFDAFPARGKYPSAMEFQLETTCNLECVMCSGEHSSAIRKNREKGVTANSPYDSRFVRELTPFLAHLSEARFNGGEPFLIGLYPEIWEQLIRVNPDCSLFVQTNGSVLPARAREIVTQGKFHFGVSINSLDRDRLESIQKNADHGTLMENIAFFHGECERKKTTLTLCACAMRKNWEDLPGILDFANRLGAYMIFHTVMTPTHLSLWNLDAGTLGKIHSHLSALDFPARTDVQRVNQVHFQNLASLIGLWREDALKREEEGGPEDIREKTSPRDRLIAKVRAHIGKESGSGKEDKAGRLRELTGKIENLEARFPDRAVLNQVMETILLLPAELLVVELNLNDEETLFRKAMTYAERTSADKA